MHRAAAPRAEEPLVAFLRGVNVGGKNKLPMRELVPLFEELGCTGVLPHIQSGNVVFRLAKGRDERGVSDAIAKAIAARFGFAAPVITRTKSELRAIVEANPFIAERADPATLHVGFFAHAPDARGIAALDPRRSLPDRFAVRGRELYLCLPNGVARSKLTNAYFDAKLATTTTIRNWRTVLTVLEMADR